MYPKTDKLCFSVSCPGGECLFSCGPNEENREADVTDYLKAEWEVI